MIHKINGWSVIGGRWPVVGSWRPAHRKKIRNSSRYWARKSRLVPGLVCSAAILLGLLMQSEPRLPGGSGSGMASAQAAAPHQPAPEQTRTPVCLSVDATKHSPDDPAGFKSLCGKLMQASGVRPVGLPGDAGPADASATPAAQYSDAPDWYLWAQLNSQCSGSEAQADTKQVQMYAVHSDAGGAVCISNSSAERIPYVLKLRLPKGVFRIERLSFAPSHRIDGTVDGAVDKATGSANDSSTGISAPSTGSQVQDYNRAACSQLRRLEGCDNPQVATISKPGDLAPGEIAIIRFTDVARAARVSFADVKVELHNLAASTPGPAARLRRIVSGGDRYISGITEGPPSSCQKRLACIHRLILLMAQAESLHRNYQSRQTVNADPGAKTMGALERIEDSLAETSAVLSGLVPQIVLEPFTHSQRIGADAAIRGGTIDTIATVSLTDSGAHSVDSVKLGLDSSALPEGSICTPDDPAYFGSLHPGQTVRAKFVLKLPDSAQSVPARFVADVSYFTSGAPAHLRPRPW